MLCSNFYFDATSITIPEKVRGKYTVSGIEMSTFKSCEKLKEVVIPRTVTYIGDDAFVGCTNLTNITVDQDNPCYCSENGVLYNKDKSTIICVPPGLEGVFKIPSSVTFIGRNAFSFCRKLEGIEIPNSVSYIGAHAFENCSGLKSIVLPEGISELEIGVFLGCKNLSNVDLPTSTKYIKFNAFKNCKSLQEINIPSNVKDIAFNAFEGCTSIVNFNVDSKNSRFSSDDGVLYNKKKTTLIRMPAAKEGSFVVPQKVKQISEYAFHKCQKITSVTIHKNVKTIGDCAFYECNNMDLLIDDSKENENLKKGWKYIHVKTTWLK